MVLVVQTTCHPVFLAQLEVLLLSIGGGPLSVCFWAQEPTFCDVCHVSFENSVFGAWCEVSACVRECSS